MTQELKKLREALRRVKYEAASLADAQVIAIEALSALQSAQPAAVPLPPASPATKGYCNDERCCQNCFSGQGACLSPLPAQPAEVSDEDILVVAEFVGLIGPGSRVGESHSAAVRFARAILALRPQAVPMTPEQVMEAEQRSYVDGRRPVHTTDCWGDEKTEYEPTKYFNMFMFARAIEAHHRITQRADGGEKQA